MQKQDHAQASKDSIEKVSQEACLTISHHAHKTVPQLN